MGTFNIYFRSIFLVLLICSGLISLSQCIDWGNNNWAFACDFKNNDLTNAQIPGDQCGGRCATTDRCTHFTWTNWNGGTCWMKSGSVSKSEAFDTGDRGMVCGVINSGNNNGGNGNGLVLNNVITTRHENGDGKGDACALPQANYAIWLPFALGDVPELQNLKFKPDLCGHIVSINCGNGEKTIIITNSNYGGGMDLYAQATWPAVAGNIQGTQLRCSVQYTSINPLQGGDFQCFTKPSTGTNNPYYRNIGLLNTRGLLVTGAFLGNQAGAHRGDNFYYAFDVGRPIDINEQVKFTFNDGSSRFVKFSDCPDVGDVQAWK